MFGPWSEYEVLTVGPIFVGSPKMKSAFATSAVRPNTKINTIELVTAERAGAGIVFFILPPLNKLLIFSRRTLCAALAA
jgi:hypothetical protein